MERAAVAEVSGCITGVEMTVERKMECPCCLTHFAA